MDGSALSLGFGERKPAHRTTARRIADLISLESEYEARAWCESLGCSYGHLRRAVAAVGPSVDDVQDYLAAQYLLEQ